MFCVFPATYAHLYLRARLTSTGRNSRQSKEVMTLQ